MVVQQIWRQHMQLIRELAWIHHSQDAHFTKLMVQSGSYVFQRPLVMRMPKGCMKLWELFWNTFPWTTKVVNSWIMFQQLWKWTTSTIWTRDQQEWLDFWMLLCRLPRYSYYFLTQSLQWKFTQMKQHSMAAEKVFFFSSTFYWS